MTHTRIVFATDNKEKYGDIVGYLRQQGFANTMIVTNGDEVLRCLHDNPIDFAILDIDLPALDGFQICRIMKSAAFKHGNDVPVVLLSGTHQNYLASQLACSVGAYGILHAPVAGADVLHLMYQKFCPEKVPPGKASTLQYPAKALIAANDADTARMLERVVSAEGYGILAANDRKEVMRVLTMERPQIVFLSSDMATLNEAAILKQIKKTMPETAVVVIVDRGSEAIMMNAMKAGADDYIIRPFDEKTAAGVCNNATKKYHMKRLDKQMNEAELQTYSIIEGMVDGVILMDTHGKIAFINRAGNEMFRYLDVRRDHDGAIVGFNNVEFKEICSEIFVKKQRYLSCEIRTKENEEKYFVVVASPVPDVAGEKADVIIVLREVTREYQLQHQVVKTERLFAVSNLIAGAAHELNNPLAGIQLCADLVLNEPSISEKAKKYLNRIQKETDQIQSVIKSLLTLTGNYTLSKEPINPNDILEEIIEQKADQFEYANITLFKFLDEKLPVVFVDKNQIRRVFMDIIENACASMGEAKTEKCLTIRTEGQGDKVSIIISDTGPGIPQEYLTRIFEPFFTAKHIKHSKGTGLGLSIAHSIVHQHNGRIYAESASGSGSTFVVELPANKCSSVSL
ncbi:MAG: response regulator [Candidatus Brocadia sp.]|uniref:histidine kinase n=1 Tax=Candidatus Brocadia fulgida TaxID=380242 RepID=A0A0M2UTV9_9BACT|nr:MAG: two-component sensor kinase [Candidatus Brocadia fulgida]UJS20027.1 MAG: response regulator [Candidatus Brocadia sp.]